MFELWEGITKDVIVNGFLVFEKLGVFFGIDYKNGNKVVMFEFDLRERNVLIFEFR